MFYQIERSCSSHLETRCFSNEKNDIETQSALDSSDFSLLTIYRFTEQPQLSGWDWFAPSSLRFSSSCFPRESLVAVLWRASGRNWFRAPDEA